jgi:hypothetical protein
MFIPDLGTWISIFFSILGVFLTVWTYPMLARKATMASVLPMLQAVLDPFMMHTLGLNHRSNMEAVLRIWNRIRKDPKLLAGSGSDPEPK